MELITDVNNIKTMKLKHPFKLLDTSGRLFTIEEFTTVNFRATEALAIEVYGRFDDDPTNVVRFECKSVSAYAPEGLQLEDTQFIGDKKFKDLYDCQTKYLQDMEIDAFDIVSTIPITDDFGNQYYLFNLNLDNLEYVDSDQIEYSEQVGGVIE